MKKLMKTNVPSAYLKRTEIAIARKTTTSRAYKDAARQFRMAQAECVGW